MVQGIQGIVDNHANKEHTSMNIREIRAVGLRGATPEGGWRIDASAHSTAASDIDFSGHT